MKPTWTIVGVIGLLSACVGLFQAFSFNHLPRLQVVYECDGGGDTNIFEFIHALESRAGEVVMLDLRMCANGFGRQELDDRLQWDFSEDIVEAAGINEPGFRGTAEDWARVDPIIADRLSSGKISQGDIGSWDNGIPVWLVGIGQTSNPHSWVSVSSEGFDSATGPFQLSEQYTNENHVFVLSPAPVTDSLAKEVRCARREWPQWLKFVACPFL